MPFLSLTTNQPLTSEQRRDLLPQLSDAAAKVLRKSEQFVMVEVNINADMLFAGTNEPLAYMRLCSIALPPEQTAEISKTLTSTVAAGLHITPDRIYIEFSDVERHMWGWKGRTFAAK